MATRRTTRISALIQAELGRLTSREQSLEGTLLTFTSVEVSPDLRNAYVYVSTLNEQLEPERILSLLSRVAREWQHEIGARLKIKYTPRLNFRFDANVKRGDRVMEIMHELEDLNPDGHANDE
ncbi:MAG: 30S ribosome-binding factor RbfA [Verrucomicrobiales bacterium]|jgi:ribosome-binding factor A|nr:30S ribosome-binding factor RbfA [Verrucomicrobiales bacterium]